MPVAQFTDPDEAEFMARCEALPLVEWPPAPPMRLWAALDERTPQGRKGMRVLLNAVANQRPRGNSYWIERVYEWSDGADARLRQLQPVFDADWKIEREALRSKRGRKGP